MIDLKKTYLPEEVALILRVSRRTIIRYLKEGKLKGFKIGNQYRIREEDLDKFIAENS